MSNDMDLIGLAIERALSSRAELNGMDEEKRKELRESARARCLKAFKEEVGEQFQEIQKEIESDPAILHLKADIQSILEKAKQEEEEFYARYHLERPDGIEDWIQLAEVAGIDTSADEHTGMTAKDIHRKAIAFVIRERVRQGVVAENAKEARKHRSDNPSRQFVDAMVELQNKLDSIGGKEVRRKLRQMFSEELKAKNRGETYPTEGALRRYRNKRDSDANWPPGS